MTYFTQYETGLIGPLTLASDGEVITGCWFENDRYFGYGVKDEMERQDGLPVFDQAKAWLDRYFAGKAPNPRELPLGARATDFQLRVREAIEDAGATPARTKATRCSTNVDHQFQLADFPKERLFYTQGDYGLWQCSEPCHDKTCTCVNYGEPYAHQSVQDRAIIIDADVDLVLDELLESKGR